MVCLALTVNCFSFFAQHEYTPFCSFQLVRSHGQQAFKRLGLLLFQVSSFSAVIMSQTGNTLTQPFEDERQRPYRSSTKENVKSNTSPMIRLLFQIQNP